MTHLYSYFGYLLGCSQIGKEGFATYSGDTSMYDVHKYMDLDANEVSIIVQARTLSMNGANERNRSSTSFNKSGLQPRASGWPLQMLRPLARHFKICLSTSARPRPASTTNRSLSFKLSALRYATRRILLMAFYTDYYNRMTVVFRQMLPVLPMAMERNQHRRRQTTQVAEQHRRRRPLPVAVMASQV